MGIVPTINYLSDYAFPLRFGVDCDLPIVLDDEAIKQNMRVAVFIPIKAMLLKTGIGSAVPKALFEPNDQVEKALLNYSIKNAIGSNEPRVLINSNLVPIANLDTNTLELVIPFLFKNSNQGWKTLKMDIPTYGILK